MRRFDRDRRGGGRSKAAELAWLEGYLRRNLFSWMRADYYTPNLAGTLVDAFPDLVLAPADGGAPNNAKSIDPAHRFSQSLDPNKVAVPTVNADFGGRHAALFSGGQNYNSVLAASGWTFLHNGAACSVWQVFRRTGTGDYAIWATSTFAGGTPGAELVVLTGSSNLRFDVYSGSSFPVFATLTGGAPVNSTKAVHCRYGTADTPDWSVTSSGVSGASGNQSSAPSASAPTASLRIGARTNGLLPYVGYIADILFAASTDAAMRSVVERYLLLRYGLAP